MKLVIDTNVLLSGSLWNGLAAKLIDVVLDGEATLYTSDDLLAELTDVLQREKFRERLQQSRLDTAKIVAQFREVAQLVEPVAITVPVALRDADDIDVLACALSATADMIVTSDQDLLVLGVFEGIPIVDITEAIRRLGL